MSKKIISLAVVFLFIICGINTIALKVDNEKNKEKQIYEENALGLIPRNEPLPAGETVYGDPPQSFDWRDINGEDWTTQVKDQGACGSCYAFGTLASLESLYKMKISNNHLDDVDLSEQFIVSCGPNCMGAGEMKGCDGAYLESTLEFIRRYGVINEDCYEYLDSNGNCNDKCKDWKDNRLLVGSYHLLAQDTDTIKNALIRYGPLTTTMNVYKDFRSKSFEPYYPDEDVWNKNVYYHKEGKLEGSHVVTIVGYCDDPDIYSGGYWICKNSWGADFGLNEDGEINNGYDGGWFRIAYDDFDGDSDECYINYETYYFKDLSISGEVEESKLEIVEEEINLGKINSGEKYSFTFNVRNVGDTGTSLDWGIYDSPESCGSAWSYKDEDGNEFSFDNDGLRTPKNPLKQEDGRFTIYVSFKSTYDEKTEITGEIKLKDRDKTSCIESSMQNLNLKFRTKNAKSITPNNFLLKILEQYFPKIFKFYRL